MLKQLSKLTCFLETDKRQRRWVEGSSIRQLIQIVDVLSKHYKDVSILDDSILNTELFLTTVITQIQ